MLKFIDTTFEVKVDSDDAGTFEGYASVFGVMDEGMDTVEKGAFSESLAIRQPKMLWQHDTHSPIGVWPSVKEDDYGLKVKGRILPEVRQGAEAIALMKAGALNSMSIGYRTVMAVPGKSPNTRSLTQLDLHEISLVTFPMLPEAVVTGVKGIKTIREFENALRDAGFSQTEAKAIAARGFAGLRTHRDGDEHDTDQGGATALLEQLSRLKGTLS